MGDVDAAVWGFVGVIVGGLITIGAEIVRARNEASLDSAKRRDDRAIERDRLQLAKLGALQEAIDALGRVTSRISGARHDASSRAVRWLMPNEYLDAELREANRVANLRVSSLAAIVLDDEVRVLSKKALETAVLVGGTDTPEGADAAMLDHMTAIADASTRCGTVIREILTASATR